MLKIEVLIEAGARLGEGPLWDAAAQCLWWIDGWGRKVFRCGARGGNRRSWDVPSDIGAVIPRAAGGAIVALADGLHDFDPAGGGLRKIVDPDPGNPRIRINDGKVDRQGRLVFGYTDVEEKESLGRLFRMDSDRKAHRLDEGYICVNGPCWSPDGRTLYVADSPRRIIHAYDYDTATGRISNKRTFADFAALGVPGYPDGATVDAQGHVWSTRMFGGGLARLTPAGAVDRLVGLPVESVSSIAFGGPGLDIAYVTSMAQPWGDWKPREREAGALFAIHGLGVRGIAERPFAG